MEHFLWSNSHLKQNCFNYNDINIHVNKFVFFLACDVLNAKVKER